MWPVTLIQLFGAIIYCAALVFGGLQGWKWYVNMLEEKAKSRDQVEITKHNAEIAKQKAEIITASQVVELMKATQEVKDNMVKLKSDVEQLENRNEEQNEELLKAIDKVETNWRNFEHLFQKFLITRVNQFEQTLLK